MLAKNNFKRWGAPAGGFDSLGKEGPGSSSGPCTNNKNQVPLLHGLAGPRLRHGEYFGKRLFISNGNFGSSVPKLRESSPGGRKEKRWRWCSESGLWARERESERARKKETRSAAVWELIMIGRYTVLVQPRGDFRRGPRMLFLRQDPQRHRCLPRLGPDLPTRRRHTFLSDFAPSGSDQSFPRPRWCLCPVVHAIWGKRPRMIPMARIETHHIPQSLTSCLAHVFPLAAREKKPSTSALHCHQRWLPDRRDLVMRGPDCSAQSPRPTSGHLKHVEEQTFSLLILAQRCRRAGPTEYAAQGHTMTHVGDNGCQTRQTIDDRRQTQAPDARNSMLITSFGSREGQDSRSRRRLPAG